jgi:hypothetical protein
MHDDVHMDCGGRPGAPEAQRVERAGASPQVGVVSDEAARDRLPATIGDLPQSTPNHYRRNLGIFLFLRSADNLRLL